MILKYMYKTENFHDKVMTGKTIISKTKEGFFTYLSFSGGEWVGGKKYSCYCDSLTNRIRIGVWTHLVYDYRSEGLRVW